MDGLDPTYSIDSKKNALRVWHFYFFLHLHISRSLGSCVSVGRSVCDLTIGLLKGGEETTMFPSLPLKTAHTQSARFCLLFCFHRPLCSRVFRLFFYRLNNSNLTHSLYVCVCMYTTVIDCFKVIFFLLLLLPMGMKTLKIVGLFFFFILLRRSALTRTHTFFLTDCDGSKLL